MLWLLRSWQAVQIGSISHSSLSVRQVDCKPLFNVKKVFFFWKGLVKKPTPKDASKLKKMTFLKTTWPWWKKWIQHGSTWLFLLSLNKQVLPWTKLVMICSWRARHSVTVVFTRSDQRISTVEYEKLLITFQVEVWKKFWKLSPPKVSIFRVCLRTSWRNKTAGWISGPSWSRRILWQNIRGVFL